MSFIYEEDGEKFIDDTVLKEYEVDRDMAILTKKFWTFSCPDDTTCIASQGNIQIVGRSACPNGDTRYSKIAAQHFCFEAVNTYMVGQKTFDPFADRH